MRERLLYLRDKNLSPREEREEISKCCCEYGNPKEFLDAALEMMFESLVFSSSPTYGEVSFLMRIVEESSRLGYAGFFLGTGFLNLSDIPRLSRLLGEPIPLMPDAGSDPEGKKYGEYIMAQMIRDIENGSGYNTMVKINFHDTLFSSLRGLEMLAPEMTERYHRSRSRLENEMEQEAERAI